MMYQALSGDHNGFNEAIKKHKVENKIKPHTPPQEKVVYNCLECGKPGHVSWQCSYVAYPPKPHTWSIHNNINYVVYKTQEGHPKVKFLGLRNKNAPKMIWVLKTLVERPSLVAWQQHPPRRFGCPSARLEPLRRRCTGGWNFMKIQFAFILIIGLRKSTYIIGHQTHWCQRYLNIFAKSSLCRFSLSFSFILVCLFAYPFETSMRSRVECWTNDRPSFVTNESFLV